MSILVVEDDPVLRPVCRAALTHVFGGSLRVDEAATGEKALELLQANQYDLVLSDHYLGAGKTGLDVLEAASRHSPRALRVLLTGRPDANMVDAAIHRVGIHGFVHKPGSLRALEDRLSQILSKY